MVNKLIEWMKYNRTRLGDGGEGYYPMLTVERQGGIDEVELPSLTVKPLISNPDK